MAKEKDMYQTAEGGYTEEGYPLCPKKCGTFFKVKNGVFPGHEVCPVCSKAKFFDFERYGNPYVNVLHTSVKAVEQISDYALLVSNVTQKKHAFDPDKAVFTLTLESTNSYAEIVDRLTKLHQQNLSVLFFNEEAVV